MDFKWDIEHHRTYLSRKRIIQIVLVCVSIIAVIVGVTTRLAFTHGPKQPRLLIVSFDGLRWDYPKIFHPHMPSFRQFAEDGVTARLGIKPCFSTETFPNHYSIATGLYEESHGITSNTIYNPQVNKSFSPTDSTWFQEGEPIWVTAKRQGLKTGVFFWIGSDLFIRGFLPDLYRHYNFSVDFHTRIDTIITWFLNENINLGMLYFEQPDFDGHMYGIEGDQFNSTIKNVDNTLEYLLNKIDDVTLQTRLNIIVMSDHGMVNMRNKIILENYINVSDILDYECNSRAMANIFPQQGKLDVLYESLKNASSHLVVYKKQDIPIQYHYRQNTRIAPLLAVAEEGYIILLTKNSQIPHVGYHGYDNDLPNMKAFFAASGPSFKRNKSVETFNNVDVYPLVCRILGISPAPNNGTMDIVDNLLSGL